MDGIALTVRGLVLPREAGTGWPVPDLELPAGGLWLLACPQAEATGRSLLAALGGLTSAAAGHIAVGGEALAELRGEGQTGLRRWRIGWLFPQPLLEPLLTGAENVLLPIRPLLGRAMLAEYRQRAAALLKELGAAGAAGQQAAGLSPGEAWRVALARALIMGPRLLLAAEPGSAGVDLPREFPALVRQAVRDRGAGALVVGAEAVWGPVADRILRLENGGWV